MRFVVGELARLVVPNNPENMGKIYEIYAVGPYAAGDIAVLPNGTKYRIVMETAYFFTSKSNSGKHLYINHDWRLQKIDPPAEPKSLIRSTETHA